MAQTRTVSMLDRPPKRPLETLGKPITDLPMPKPIMPSAADAHPISKDIPIPKRIGKQGRVWTFPSHRLEIGDSFFVANAHKTGNFWCKWAHGQYPGKRFVYRRVEGGVRIWRVEAKHA